MHPTKPCVAVYNHQTNKSLMMTVYTYKYRHTYYKNHDACIYMYKHNGTNRKEIDKNVMIIA